MSARTTYCRVCHSPMHKAGWAWSGTKQVQRYRCPKCGHTTIHPLFTAYSRRHVSKHQIDGTRLVRVRSA